MLIPGFIRERSVRTNLQALYISLIAAKENCSNLLSVNSGELERAPLAGMPLAKDCFRGTTRWLARFREFAINPEVFESQILDPARAPARFLTTARQLHSVTTTMTGLVFSKSRQHYDRYYRDNVITLALVAPEFKTCMSLRHFSINFDGVKQGTYAFNNVMPLPFVNRIHPNNPTTTPISRSFSLAGLEFLKSSMQDLPRMSFTIALEKTCIVECSQDEKERLAVPFVLNGRLISVAPPLLTISDARESKSFNFVISDDLSSCYDGGLDRSEEHTSELH